jgi:hypothetical protein
MSSGESAPTRNRERRVTPMDMLEATTFVEDIVIDFPPIDEIARCWPIIEPILKRATDRGKGYEPIDVLHLVMTGRMSLILVREGRRIIAVAATEVRQLPRCRLLDVTFCAGNGLKRWIEQLIEVLDAQAETAGCSDIMVGGRKGWLKFGFELDGVIMHRQARG